MNGLYDLDEGIRRLQAFEAAGADLLYLPVPPGRAELARVLASVTAPVNALAAGPLRDLTRGRTGGDGRAAHLDRQPDRAA